MEPREETARVAGFSDAVFAVAITLLVLDLWVPPPGSPGLFAKLLQRWPQHLAFLMTFVNVGMMWVFHHGLFTIIRRVDRKLLLLNVMLLLGVVIAPYPVKLMGEYALQPDEKVAAMIHAGTFVMIMVFFYLLWRHASQCRLLDPRADPRTIRMINRTLALAPLLYLASGFVASVNTVASMVFNGAIAVYLASQKWYEPNISDA